jgi:hypothetical protein
MIFGPAQYIGEAQVANNTVALLEDPKASNLNPKQRSTVLIT